jgi:hypothetical protein
MYIAKAETPDKPLFVQGGADGQQAPLPTP